MISKTKTEQGNVRLQKGNNLRHAAYLNHLKDARAARLLRTCHLHLAASSISVKLRQNLMAAGNYLRSRQAAAKISIILCVCVCVLDCGATVRIRNVLVLRSPAGVAPKFCL